MKYLILIMLVLSCVSDKPKPAQKVMDAVIEAKVETANIRTKGKEVLKICPEAKPQVDSMIGSADRLDIQIDHITPVFIELNDRVEQAEDDSEYRLAVQYALGLFSVLLIAWGIYSKDSKDVIGGAAVGILSIVLNQYWGLVGFVGLWFLAIIAVHGLYIYYYKKKKAATKQKN